MAVTGTRAAGRREGAGAGLRATAEEAAVAQAAGSRSASDVFRKFARGSSEILGSVWAFVAACLLILLWGMTGPLFGFSETWQLVINTSTTIVTFLMVFLLQNTQNRDSTAIHLKLDELLRGTRGPRTGLVRLEELSDDQLRDLQEEFERIARQPDSPTAEEPVVATSR